jgi:hypothetical protein
MPSRQRLPLRPRALLCALVVLAFALRPAAGALADGGYRNPFDGDTYYVGRTDMGVDACLSAGEPIRAVGAGVVVGIQHDWFKQQPYIWYELTAGADAGRYVYVAEQIDRLARIGQVLSVGDVVARYAKKGTCIEIGWSAADGTTTADATTGYTEGQVTTAGVSFARFLIAAGVEGTFELHPTAAQAAKTKNKKQAGTHRQPSSNASPSQG